MNYTKLPADPNALILGIIALLVSFVGCCCGIFAFIPLVLSIIGLVMANRSLKAYKLNPEVYSHQSKSNVITAKVINIIALVISAVVTLLYLIYFLLYGALFSTAFMEAYKQQNNSDGFEYEWENDSINDYDEDYYDLDEETIKLDSLNVEDLLETEIQIDSINNE